MYASLELEKCEEKLKHEEDPLRNPQTSERPGNYGVALGVISQNLVTYQSSEGTPLQSMTSSAMFLPIEDRAYSLNRLIK